MAFWHSERVEPFSLGPLLGGGAREVQPEG